MHKTIFIGTSQFAVPALKALNSSAYKPSLVIAPPCRPQGRKRILAPSPVKETANSLKLKTAQPEKIIDVIGEVGTLAPEIMVLVSYGKFIPREFMDLARGGIVNIHPSLLPKYRGASPIQTAILNGDKETGVSIILLDDKLDHGGVLKKESIVIKPSHDAQTLSEELAIKGADLLIKILPDYLAGKIEPVPQDDLKATFTRKLTREDGKLDFSKSAQELDRQIRAYKGWPETYTYFNSKKCKIISAQIAREPLDGKELYLRANNGYLRITELQIEGKQKITGKEFCAGYNHKGFAQNFTLQ